MSNATSSIHSAVCLPNPCPVSFRQKHNSLETRTAPLRNYVHGRIIVCFRAGLGLGLGLGLPSKNANLTSTSCSVETALGQANEALVTPVRAERRELKSIEPAAEKWDAAGIHSDTQSAVIADATQRTVERHSWATTRGKPQAGNCQAGNCRST